MTRAYIFNIWMQTIVAYEAQFKELSGYEGTESSFRMAELNRSSDPRAEKLINIYELKAVDFVRRKLTS